MAKKDASYIYLNNRGHSTYELGVNPIYFVSPEVLEDEMACAVLREEIKNGAVIGAHLHPDFIGPEKTPLESLPQEKFPCFGYSYEVEKAKIKNLKLLIEERLEVTTHWYRAARFGADEDTIRILAELGFRHDSSFTPGISWKMKGGPDHSKIVAGTYRIEPYGITEHPITICGRRFGILGRFLPDSWLFYRWLRPTHMTYFEQRSLIDEMAKCGRDELVLMFHSTEVMVNKSPYVRFHAMQEYFIWRLRKAISYAIKMGYRPCTEEKDI